MIEIIQLLLLLLLVISVIIILSKLKILYSLSGFVFLYLFFLTLVYRSVFDHSLLLSIYLLTTFALPALIITFIFRQTIARPVDGIPLIEERLVRVDVVLLISVLAGVAANVYLAKFAQGTTGYELKALEYSRVFSNSRYVYGEGIPMQVRALNVLCHVGAMIGAIVFMESLLIKHKISLLFLLPATLLIVESILTGTKSLTILVLVYFLSAILVVICYYNMTKIPRKILIIAASLCISLLAIVILVHYVRVQGNLSIPQIVYKILSSYFIIPFFAFMDWFEYNLTIFPQSIGTQIFEGISYYISRDVKTGEFYYVTIGGILYQTNVYTAYRAIIEDFGMILSPFVFTGIMLVSVVIQKKINRNITYIPILLMISNFIFFSFAGSLYKFLTNIFSILLVLVYFATSRIIEQRLH